MDIERNRREALVVARTTLATVQAAATSAAEAVTAAEEHEANALKRVQQAELMLDGVMERPTYDAGVRDLDSAKVDHVLAVRKTKAATDERSAATAKVEKAQKAVEAAVDALLDAEKPARHAQFEQLARQIMPLAETIAAYIPTGIHRQAWLLQRVVTRRTTSPGRSDGVDGWDSYASASVGHQRQQRNP